MMLNALKRFVCKILSEMVLKMFLKTLVLTLSFLISELKFDLQWVIHDKKISFKYRRQTIAYTKNFINNYS